MAERAGMQTTDGEEAPAVAASLNGSAATEAPALAPGAADQEPAERKPARGPVEWVMSELIRKLAWSKLSEPKVAISISALGLLLGMLVGATAPNTETLKVELPLSHLLPSLANENVLASVMLYTGNILACLGLAGMLVGAQPGLAAQPAPPAAGERRRRRGDGRASPRLARRTRQATRPTAGSRRGAAIPTRPARWRSSEHTRRTRRRSATCGSRSPPYTGRWPP